MHDPEPDVDPPPAPDPEDVVAHRHGPIELICPECGDTVAITDLHAFLLGLHQRVCRELTHVNGVEG